MFEVAIFLCIAAIAAWYILPSFFKSNAAEQSAYLEPLKIPEDSTLRRHFITHLKSEIESALHLCPDDTVLQRRYNTLVAVELNHLL
jgi:hypothetical protein